MIDSYESKENNKILRLPTIKRLPTYLHILKRLETEGEEYVSTTALINELDFKPILVRKDLVLMGIPGKPRTGYRTRDIIEAIEKFLGWHKVDEAFLVGTGALGSALLGHKPFEENGLKIVAGFDVDPKRVGKVIHGKKIFHISKLKELAQEMNVKVGIITVPWQAAQEVADILIDAGIIGIWNFSMLKLKVPPDVVCHNENLSGGLAVFSVKLQQQRDKLS
ncbi:MAG: redox-sensing transcriptional repressor Rex [Victivallales bacterium]|nr:redox-sensing transcriptional repressor Rex [Victivallales bacterium]